MRDDESQMGHRGEWASPVKNVLSCHCYCHGATEAIWNLLLIDFDMRELYLYCRIRIFEKSGISRKSVSRIFGDELQTEKVKNILYREGG